MASPSRYPLFAYQPFTLMYKLGYMGFIAAGLPFWVGIGFFPSLKPHPKWSIQQTVMSFFMYRMTDMGGKIGLTPKLSLEPGKEGERFQLIDPSVFPSQLYQGPLKSPQVPPATIGATWHPEKPKCLEDLKDSTVALVIHGGGFVLGDGRDEFCGFAASNILETGAVTHALLIDYRLSGYQRTNPFPAALQDTLTSYLHLARTLEVKRIVVVGDSAGGNLVIALLRYLEEYPIPGIAKPVASVLVSPWVTPLDALHTDYADNAQRHACWLSASFLRWGATAYSDGVADAESNPYITPLGNPFRTTVPMFVTYGELEILTSDIEKWIEEAERAGNTLSASCQEAAVHDTLLLGQMLGWTETVDKEVKKIGDFLREQVE